MKGDLAIIFTLLGLIVLCLLGIGANGKWEHDNLVSGCREAGGALVGEICVIRRDCAKSE